MDGLAHHVVDAGGEQLQGLFERLAFVEGDERAPRALADDFWEEIAAAAIADEEGFDGLQIGLADAGHPFLEFVGTQAGGGATPARSKLEA